MDGHASSPTDPEVDGARGEASGSVPRVRSVEELLGVRRLGCGPGLARFRPTSGRLMLSGDGLVLRGRLLWTLVLGGIGLCWRTDPLGRRTLTGLVRGGVGVSDQRRGSRCGLVPGVDVSGLSLCLDGLGLGLGLRVSHRGRGGGGRLVPGVDVGRLSLCLDGVRLSGGRVLGLGLGLRVSERGRGGAGRLVPGVDVSGVSLCLDTLGLGLGLGLRVGDRGRGGSGGLVPGVDVGGGRFGLRCLGAGGRSGRRGVPRVDVVGRRGRSLCGLLGGGLALGGAGLLGRSRGCIPGVRFRLRVGGCGRLRRGRGGCRRVRRCGLRMRNVMKTCQKTSATVAAKTPSSLVARGRTIQRLTSTTWAASSPRATATTL